MGRVGRGVGGGRGWRWGCDLALQHVAEHLVADESHDDDWLNDERKCVEKELAKGTLAQVINSMQKVALVRLPAKRNAGF